MEIDNLNKYQKVYLTYKTFNYWNNGNIVYKGKKILPTDFDVININDILKVYLICSKIDSDKCIDKLINHFDKLNIYEKIDFIIYLFDMVNDIDIVPNRLTNNMSLKDLSNKLIKYKLSL